MCVGYMQILHHFIWGTWASMDFGISRPWNQPHWYWGMIVHSGMILPTHKEMRMALHFKLFEDRSFYCFVSNLCIIDRSPCLKMQHFSKLTTKVTIHLSCFYVNLGNPHSGLRRALLQLSAMKRRKLKCKKLSNLLKSTIQNEWKNSESGFIVGALNHYSNTDIPCFSKIRKPLHFYERPTSSTCFC